MFELISSINHKDLSTFEKKIFITIDVDWAHDVILANTIDILEERDVKATWFITHNTPLLERLRSNPNFELGIHPNFNFLLQCDYRYGDTDSKVIDYFLKIVPDAKSVRSHSLIQSSKLTDLYRAKGLTHESNMFIPEYSKINVKPFEHLSGVILCPYIWGDYMDFSLGDKRANFKSLSLINGLKIFNFHPIHIYLNTDNIDRFNSTRNLHHNPKKLIDYYNKDAGVMDRLMELILVNN